MARNHVATAAGAKQLPALAPPPRAWGQTSSPRRPARCGGRWPAWALATVRGPGCCGVRAVGRRRCGTGMGGWGGGGSAGVAAPRNRSPSRPGRAAPMGMTRDERWAANQERP